MPERCPHCREPISSVRKEPTEGRPYEVWQCEDCEKEWQHPEETVLNKDLDFSETGDQVSRRRSDTDLYWE